MRPAFAVVALLLAACPPSSRTTDTRSDRLASPKDRVAFLCEYTLCPTTPSDAAFHIVVRDASRGFLAGPGDVDVTAVVKVKPDDMPRWVAGCAARRGDMKPPWLEGLLKERGWKVTTAPDFAQCGAESRLLHVKDGLVVRWIRSAQ